MLCERKKHGRTEREATVTKPEGLDAIFRAHYERIARVIGRAIHDQARAEELAVEEVALRAGPALLIENFDEKGTVKRATVVRSTSERVYSVSSRNRKLRLKVANILL